MEELESERDEATEVAAVAEQTAAAAAAAAAAAVAAASTGTTAGNSVEMETKDGARMSETGAAFRPAGSAEGLDGRGHDGQVIAPCL